MGENINTPAMCSRDFTSSFSISIFSCTDLPTWTARAISRSVEPLQILHAQSNQIFSAAIGENGTKGTQSATSPLIPTHWTFKEEIILVNYML